MSNSILVEAGADYGFLFIRNIVCIKNLRAFHKAAFCWGKGFAAMQGGAIIPHDKVANLPGVCPAEFWAGGVFVERVE